ncbi:hypothetical protein BAMA_00615 [Bacillus manliponensis]|uniref:Uncharacterized protein n=1 Tax=Bacillus manliponensis TaxID=574376 RepID=A0A073K3Y7_9BACI|nr:hypothetical protein [Bacillus manliponensis]KEK21306.1 hypothetical protein BAMA_00615 [Bacillus manliponensis]
MDQMKNTINEGSNEMLHEENEQTNTINNINPLCESVKYYIYKKESLLEKHQDMELPFMHLNVLAQMLYEAFHDRSLNKVKPIVLIFKEHIVEGLISPGAYFIDFENDCFIKAESIDIQELKEEFKDRGDVLAIGYISLEGDNQLEDLAVISEELIDRLKEILCIHGELKDDISSFIDLKKFKVPLLKVQWLKRKNSK